MKTLGPVKHNANCLIFAQQGVCKRHCIVWCCSDDCYSKMKIIIFSASGRRPILKKKYNLSNWNRYIFYILIIFNWLSIASVWAVKLLLDIICTTFFWSRTIRYNAFPEREKRRLDRRLTAIFTNVFFFRFLWLI